MDNLTHSLTGLMLSRAGLARLGPRTGFMLIVAANVPDLDIVSGFAGRASYLDWHRAHTHAFAFVPLMALLPLLLARWSLAWPQWTERIVGGISGPWIWWKAWLAACIGVASHLLLDWTNNYGIRLGLPFEDAWHRLDLLFVLDPWMWTLLLFGVIAPFLSRLVSSEIGARKTSGGGAAWFVLIAVSVYIGGRYLLHEQALGLLSSRVFDNQTPRRVAAFPTFGNPLRWRAIAELSDGYWVSQMNLLEDFDPAEGRVFYQSTDRDLITKASGTEDFKAFLRFNRFPYWRILAAAEGVSKVELYDMRFGDPSSPGFLATVEIQGGRPEHEAVQFGTPKI